MAAPQLWKREMSRFYSEGTFSPLNRQVLFKLCAAYVANKPEDTAFRQQLDLGACLEILHGRGDIPEKLQTLQAFPIYFETEDCFLRCGGKLGRVWNPVKHEFFHSKATTETVRLLKEDMECSMKYTYKSPELEPGMPEFRDGQQQWVFLSGMQLRRRCCLLQ